MEHVETVIAGAGIAGLAARLALRDRPVLILEKSKLDAEVGAGLQLGPNAVSALKTLGAWDHVAPITSMPPALNIHDGVTGKLLRQVNFGKAFETRYGASYRVALRQDLHAALLSSARAISDTEIRSNHPIQKISAGLNGTVLNEAIVASQLIAADGIHSAVRQALFPGTKVQTIPYIHHRAFPALNAIRSKLPLDCVHLWLLPRAHVVHYAVGQPQKLNLVAIAPVSETIAELAERACQDLSDILASSGEFSPWPAHYLQPLSRWSTANVQLIGDAAHATLPYLAQGAAMALEDAAALPLPRDQFELERRARAARLHRESLAAGRTYHAEGLYGRARNAVLRTIPEALFFSQLNWLYRHSQ